jgi:hypothetical protein
LSGSVTRPVMHLFEGCASRVVVVLTLRGSQTLCVASDRFSLLVRLAIATHAGAMAG